MDPPDLGEHAAVSQAEAEAEEPQAELQEEEEEEVFISGGKIKFISSYYTDKIHSAHLDHI